MLSQIFNLFGSLKTHHLLEINNINTSKSLKGLARQLDMESSQNTFSKVKHMISQDIEATLAMELEKMMANNFFEKDGFLRLFEKFISQEGQESVVWEDIEKPLHDSVSK